MALGISCAISLCNELSSACNSVLAVKSLVLPISSSSPLIFLRVLSASETVLTPSVRLLDNSSDNCLASSLVVIILSTKAVSPPTTAPITRDRPIDKVACKAVTPTCAINDEVANALNPALKEKVDVVVPFAEVVVTLKDLTNLSNSLLNFLLPSSASSILAIKSLIGFSVNIKKALDKLVVAKVTVPNLSLSLVKPLTKLVSKSTLPLTKSELMKFCQKICTALVRDFILASKLCAYNA